MVADAGILAARGSSVGIDARRGLVDRRAADVGWIVCPESAEIHSSYGRGAEKVGAQAEWWKTVALSTFNSCAAAFAAFLLGKGRAVGCGGEVYGAGRRSDDGDGLYRNEPPGHVGAVDADSVSRIRLPKMTRDGTLRLVLQSSGWRAQSLRRREPEGFQSGFAKSTVVIAEDAKVDANRCPRAKASRVMAS
jgi:hypothetical protein